MKLTDSEIVKVLECHIKRQCWNDCPNATEERLLLSRPCSQMIAEDALDLINKQKAEIEELWADNNYLFETMPHMKTEAIKEFAEKLKCRSHRFKTIDRIFVDCIPLDYIDNLVKEMVGETDGQADK